MDTILAKYMGLIHETVADTGTHVFRGQSDAGWRLRSGASRRLVGEGIEESHPQYVEEYLEYHRDLLDRARRIAPYGRRGPTETGLQLLARLQHFGAATGLLDFSYSPLVALWFASEDASRDGKLFSVSHEPPNTEFVTEQRQGEDIAHVLSMSPDATEPTYLLWEPVVDGSRALDLQRDALVAAGADADGIYPGRASGVNAGQVFGDAPVIVKRKAGRLQDKNGHDIGPDRSKKGSLISESVKREVDEYCFQFANLIRPVPAAALETLSTALQEGSPDTGRSLALWDEDEIYGKISVVKLGNQHVGVATPVITDARGGR